MRDYYQDGFDAAYGRPFENFGDFPLNDGDRWSFRRGIEDGQRRRRMADELDREQFGNDY